MFLLSKPALRSYISQSHLSFWDAYITPPPFPPSDLTQQFSKDPGRREAATSALSGKTITFFSECTIYNSRDPLEKLKIYQSMPSAHRSCAISALVFIFVWRAFQILNLIVRVDMNGKIDYSNAQSRPGHLASTQTVQFEAHAIARTKRSKYNSSTDCPFRSFHNFICWSQEWD